MNEHMVCPACMVVTVTRLNKEICPVCQTCVSCEGGYCLAGDDLQDGDIQHRHQ